MNNESMNEEIERSLLCRPLPSVSAPSPPLPPLLWPASHFSSPLDPLSPSRVLLSLPPPHRAPPHSSAPSFSLPRRNPTLQPIFCSFSLHHRRNPCSNPARGAPPPPLPLHLPQGPTQATAEPVSPAASVSDTACHHRASPPSPSSNCFTCDPPSPSPAASQHPATTHSLQPTFAPPLPPPAHLPSVSPPSVPLFSRSRFTRVRSAPPHHLFSPISLSASLPPLSAPSLSSKITQRTQQQYAMHLWIL